MINRLLISAAEGPCAWLCGDALRDVLRLRSVMLRVNKVDDPKVPQKWQWRVVRTDPKIEPTFAQGNFTIAVTDPVRTKDAGLVPVQHLRAIPPKVRREVLVVSGERMGNIGRVNRIDEPRELCSITLPSLSLTVDEPYENLALLL